MHANNWKSYLLHSSLFIATLFTTTLAGAEWIQIIQPSWTATILQGLWYSLPFLGILTVHEFGHYFAARYYSVSVTLPYYLPLYFPGLSLIGTLGAFIRIKSILKSRTIVFDVGVAGPLAGFLASLIVLYYGFTHLPEKDYIFSIHKDYAQHGLNYEKYVYSYEYLRASDSLFSIQNKIPFIPQEEYYVFSTGKNLLFEFFEKYVATDASLVPNRYEMYHYPLIFAGFLSLFFTALNLIPLGQLDGGHILYALIGAERQRKIAPYLFSVFVFLGTISFLKETFGLHPMESFDDMLRFAPLYILFLYLIFSRVYALPLNNIMLAVIVFSLQFVTLSLYPNFKGFEQWWLFAMLIGRFLGIYHPPSIDDEPLDLKRKIIGWFSFIIFIICFSPQPLVMETIHR